MNFFDVNHFFPKWALKPEADRTPSKQTYSRAYASDGSAKQESTDVCALGVHVNGAVAAQRKHVKR